MNEKEQLLILEPSPIVTEGLTNIIEYSYTLGVASTAFDADEALNRIVAFRPVGIIINPLCLTKEFSLDMLHREFPEMKCVAIVYRYLDYTLLNGFDAVIDIMDSHLVIRRKLEDLFVTEKESQQEENTDEEELTKREIDVLILVAKGMMSRDIADKLHISLHTVKTHRKNITRKTNIRSAAGLSMYAIMNNLMEDESTSDEVLPE